MKTHLNLYAALAVSIIPIVCNAQSDPVPAVDHRYINLEKGDLALSGYDPVSYFESSGPIQGSKAIEVVYEGVRYRFVNEANREAFESEPGRYLPEFGGWCAWAMLEGEQVDVNPETYRIYDGKLLLYYDGLFGDTLKKWNKKAESAPESELYQTAKTNWNKIVGR
ncbi:YHS domain-containing (seleno)protein [Pelagicoccus sp. SDUM812003]|uniref:YHS domain-containing (seleno)protein n=1 Tax=Pelagicoccus sp. SDUM812003 TaxID=3041267 RepID=UPI00280CAD8B|nr:YHS domain-containing (seleno)protein [Pelagicoccus sp. SDUM812003]MDQ8202210.1 YHS domain-containing (seleno)protein [Pelagicoccus sp. SDUM812003]